ncbi:hypothetical protein NEOLEDRAFT_1142006 [Neolentinus lepideus HHB14362 ss-1]|uniref:Uncharacterized protein n=1 Tax=Neolentinus lepideus HHB14362 ss-1 TaxID=1314782 RepID=A0A165NC21_9AGAM|nr:hypothetical protein NEOLEDRAFT_1142006 [Neolentinus lepideus HHB14362 ss-1]
MLSVLSTLEHDTTVECIARLLPDTYMFRVLGDRLLSPYGLQAKSIWTIHITGPATCRIARMGRLVGKEQR